MSSATCIISGAHIAVGDDAWMTEKSSLSYDSGWRLNPLEEGDLCGDFVFVSAASYRWVRTVFVSRKDVPDKWKHPVGAALFAAALLANVGPRAAGQFPGSGGALRVALCLHALERAIEQNVDA